MEQNFIYELDDEGSLVVKTTDGRFVCKFLDCGEMSEQEIKELLSGVFTNYAGLFMAELEWANENGKSE